MTLEKEKMAFPAIEPFNKFYAFVGRRLPDRVIHHGQRVQRRENQDGEHGPHSGVRVNHAAHPTTAAARGGGRIRTGTGRGRFRPRNCARRGCRRRGRRGGGSASSCRRRGSWGRRHEGRRGGRRRSTRTRARGLGGS